MVKRRAAESSEVLLLYPTFHPLSLWGKTRTQITMISLHFKAFLLQQKLHSFSPSPSSWHRYTNNNDSLSSNYCNDNELRTQNLHIFGVLLKVSMLENDCNVIEKFLSLWLFRCFPRLLFKLKLITLKCRPSSLLLLVVERRCVQTILGLQMIQICASARKH